MEANNFMQLKVGDRVYDRLKNREMEVIEVTQPTRFDEGAVRMRWVETQTIYSHGSIDFELVK